MDNGTGMQEGRDVVGRCEDNDESTADEVDALILTNFRRLVSHGLSRRYVRVARLWGQEAAHGARP